MNVLTSRIVCAALMLPLAGTAQAAERFSSSGRADQIVIRVDVSDQQMIVLRGGRRLYTWPVSTAGEGHVTPRGTWQPQWFSRDHRSSLYEDAPMPFAIFYDGDYAIHATEAVSALGRPASHGCVRLSPGHAETLYELVYALGRRETYIVVQD